MVEIEGKRGRQVPLLLMPDIKKAMEILVKRTQLITFATWTV